MRTELKYNTSWAVAEKLFLKLKPIAKIDENTGRSNSYENVNIYFDDRTLSTYQEKHEGYSERAKLRFRLTKPLGNKNFTRQQIEIKNRRGIKTEKVKFPVSSNLSTEVIKNIQEYMYKKHNYNLGKHFLPVVGVRYNRVPIFLDYIPGLRITFDTQIKSFHDFNNLEYNGPQPLLLPPSDCLIEIKCSRQLPSFALQLIQQYDLRRVTYSKYAKALEKTYSVYERTLS